MLESVAILSVSKDLYPNENLYKTCDLFLKEFRTLNYSVEKISFIKSDENVMVHEINFLSKEYDLLVILGENSQFEVICKALTKICCKEIDACKNQYLQNGAQPPSVQVLKLVKNNEITDVLYHIQRIFILKTETAVNVFQHLLKNFLEDYKKIKKFQKKFQILMNLESENNLNGLKILKKGLDHNIVTVQIEKDSFDEIIKEELVLRKQFSDRITEVCDIDFFMENIYRSREDHIYESIKIIEECLDMYSLDNVFLTFNGGKDCTVLLHLLDIVKKIKYPDYLKPISCLYVRDNDTFPEQDKFVSQCQVYYKLDILSLTLDMKDALEEFLTRYPHMKACFLGTRRTDPYSEKLKSFQMTDKSWPSIMRVSPLLEWNYSDIWNYLLYYKIPYCELYDQGYTSLGSASCTQRNPYLLHHSVKLGKEIYLPAYKLLNETEERNGRVKINK